MMSRLCYQKIHFETPGDEKDENEKLGVGGRTAEDATHQVVFKNDQAVL